MNTIYKNVCGHWIVLFSGAIGNGIQILEEQNNLVFIRANVFS